MSMTKPAYPALFHYIQKRMADVTYPITKEALLSQIGDRTVFVDWMSRCRCAHSSNPFSARPFPALRSSIVC